MKHEFDIIGFYEKSLSKTELEKIKEHLHECPECRNDFKAFKQIVSTFENMRDEFELSDDTAMEPLPQKIIDVLNEKQQTTDTKEKENFEEKLTGFINDIKQKTMDFLQGNQEPLMSYQLEQTTTMHQQPELKLRKPIPPLKYSFDVEKACHIEITSDMGRNIITFTKDDRPISNMKVKINKGNNKNIKIIKTDENGQVFINYIVDK